MKKQYIKAVTELLLQGKDTDAVLGNLQKTLEAKGFARLYPDVLQGVHAQLEMLQRTKSARVTLARTADEAKLKAALAQSLETLGAPSNELVVTEDPSLIGGYTVSFNGKRVNNSYKEKLVSLYRSITTM